MWVRVDDLGIYESLAEYSKLSGVPINDLVNEALANFIEADIQSRLESITVKTASA